MEFREMIEQASKKAGSQRTLADKLGIPEQHVSNAKTAKRGLTDEACAKIAEMIGIPFGDVIAARNYALAKEAEAKEFWRPFVEQHRKAAAWAIAIATGAIFGIGAPNEAYATDTSNVSGTPAQPDLERVCSRQLPVIHIIGHAARSLFRWIMGKVGPARSNSSIGTQNYGFPGWPCSA